MDPELHQPDPQAIQSWIFDQLPGRIISILEAETGERPEVKWELCPAVPPLDGTRRFRQGFRPITGALWIATRELVVFPAPFLDQICAGLAKSLSSRLGREIECEEREEIALPPPAGAWAAVRIRLGALDCALYCGIEQRLLDSLTAKDAPAAIAAVPEQFRGSQTFDLLLDVELPVSISFGRAQVPLKDVLKLTTGSIVELNRTIDEPVEVIVNNCVIARGEVVVVEGNFGVRIHEVISRQERLRTLS